MPLRLDSARTILDCLDHYAALRGDEDAYVFIVDGETQELHLSYRALHSRARALARDLRRRNLEGQALMLLFPAGLDFIVAFFGCLYAGAAAVPANLARGSHHFGRLKTIMQDSGCRAVLTLPSLRTLTRDGLAAAGLDAEGFEVLSETPGGPETALEESLPQASPEAIAFIQYTSGSTGNPKGVVVTHAQLIANERAIRRTSDMPEFMRGAGWLPQFHDMGLIGNLLQPLALGGSYAFMSPLHFIQSPLRWLDMLSRHRAFASAAPCFALEMCVEAMKEGGRDGWDLSGLDTIFCGAEPISQATLARFNACLAPYGLGPDVVKPCYGMAETTLIISGGLPKRAPRFLRVDREALKRGDVLETSADDGTQDIVCCGGPVEAHVIEVVSPDSGEILGDGAVGELWCAGPSIAAGYWRKEQATRESFAARTACGKGPFLRTGDLGFRNADGIYVTGRIKEMLIIRGRNHYPHDMEATIAAVFADRGLDVQVAVFQVDESSGAAGVAACVELPRRMSAFAPEEPARLASAARQAVSRVHDVLLKDMLLLKYGGIPRTSSGKIQRLLCAELYRSGAIEARLKSNSKQRGLPA